MAGAPSATVSMMRLRDAKIRAAAANKVTLGAEQTMDAVEKDVQDLKYELGVERARTEASTIALTSWYGSSEVCTVYRQHQRFMS